MTKPARNVELGESRRAQAPGRGARVEYPVPPPPVTHIEVDGKLHERMAPVGHEEWFPARVLAVDHYERTVSADDHMAILEPDGGGPTLTLSVVFLREPADG